MDSTLAPPPDAPRSDLDHDPDLDHDRDFVARAGDASDLAISLLSALPDCVKVIDLDGRLSSMSQAGLCALEIDDFAIVAGRPWWDLWPPEAKDRLTEAVAMVRQGRPDRFNAFCPTAKGAPRWWDVSATPLRDASGAVTGVIAVSRDVTAQVEAARESEARRAEAEAALALNGLLLREVDHRVRNSLMLIVGLLRMQGRGLADPAAVAALAEAAQRVQTVARVHERLYRSADMARLALDDYLTELCGDLALAFGGEGRPLLAVEAAPLRGPADTAVALGLIVTELVANAYRHGGMDGRGRVTVRLTGGSAPALSVEDSGRGLPAGFAAEGGRGLGMRIVLAKAGELGAALSWGGEGEGRGGATFTLALPAAAFAG